MGRFKTEEMRTNKRMARQNGTYEEPVKIPKGFRNNNKNQRLFKKLYEERESKKPIEK